jgi:hypothetical protein
MIIRYALIQRNFRIFGEQSCANEGRLSNATWANQ